MGVTVSVVIPTIGRDTLKAAEASCVGFDEILVIPDSTGDYGYTPRHKGMELATGTHLAFLDDDDIYLPGTADLMREAACDVPVVFRMDHPTHGILWRDKKLEFGNVSTQMILAPNRPDQLGTWAPHAPGLKEPGGDYTFLKGCVERMGGPVWRKEIISVIRPHERKPSIAVVTPWRDHREFIPDYLAAVRGADEVWVVDNASEPPLDLPGIRCQENLGFCKANNLGLFAAGTDAVLFLNNDVYATDPGWLREIRLAVEPGVLVGASLRTDRHAGEHPYLDGWCIAGMREDLLEIGGWDESLMEPAYYSDNDLCLRARAAGLSLREVRCGVHHKLNGSTNPQHPLTVKATVENRARYESLVRELVAA